MQLCTNMQLEFKVSYSSTRHIPSHYLMNVMPFNFWLVKYLTSSCSLLITSVRLYGSQYDHSSNHLHKHWKVIYSFNNSFI